MNLKTIDTKLTALAGLCLLVGGGTGFSGLIPVGAAVVISLVGVLAGAVAKSPVFSGTPESGWNVALQILAALFAGAAGSAQLDAVQKLLMPVHPTWAAKIGLGAMLGSQVFAYLAQKRDGAGVPPAVVLLFGLAFLGPTSCAHVNAITKDVESCVTADGPQAIKDLEHDAIPALTDAFMCDASTGFDPNAIPMCLKDAFVKECSNLGPDAERFELCVITTVENDPLANPIARARAKATRMRLVRNAGRL